MALILKIAAGVIIGLLFFRILVFQGTEMEYEEASKDMLYTQDFRNKFIVLTNAIHNYYRRKKKIPEFISDLKCVDVLNSYRQKIDCAEVFSNGVFYINYKDDWASAEPYLLGRKLYIKCRTSKSFAIKEAEGGGMYNGCTGLDVNAIPKQQTPDYDCKSTSDEVEKLVCSSDRLIDIDNKLSLIYKNLLSKSADDKKQQVIDDKSEFIERRRHQCHTTECIDAITRKKITRLEFLGVWKPK